jgi:K+-sensing histidine kinase KdpD
MKDLAQLAHDLRSPLARAKTVAKLLAEASEGERVELQAMLLQALEEMDKRISELCKE